MESCSLHGAEAKVTTKQLCISKVPIFNHLTDEEMREIAELSHHRSYRKGELIFEAGDASDHLYIVHRGKAKVYRLSESGKEQLLRVLGPGDFLGELSLFADETLTHYAEAVEESDICMLHRPDIKRLILDKPAIALKLLEAFSLRMNEVEKSLEWRSTQDTEKRLASYLLELADRIRSKRGNQPQPSRVALPMSKKDVASYIGMSQETLSRRLSHFQNQGWIRMQGQREIHILDMDALYELSVM